MADHNEAEVIFRLGQLRQRYIQHYGQLTYKGHIHPDHRTVARQNHEHTIKQQLFYAIREIDDLFGIRDMQFSGNPPINNWPPLTHYKPRRRRGNR